MCQVALAADWAAGEAQRRWFLHHLHPHLSMVPPSAFSVAFSLALLVAVRTASNEEETCLLQTHSKAVKTNSANSDFQWLPAGQDLDGPVYQAFIQASSHAATNPIWNAKQESVEEAVQAEQELDLSLADSLPMPESDEAGLQQLVNEQLDGLVKPAKKKSITKPGGLAKTAKTVKTTKR